MKRVLLGLATGLVMCYASSASAQPTPVVLVHGINSNQGTWDDLYTILASDSRFSPYRTNLTSTNPLNTQANALAMFILGNVVGAVPIVAGHSQGGLIARVTSRSMPASGILTIGTPHAGAPIADEVPDAQQWLFQGVAFHGTAAYSLDDIIDDPWHPLYNAAFAGLDNAFYVVATLTTALQAMFTFLDAFNNQALNDLTPGSSFYQSLASQLGSESGTGNRRAIQTQIGLGYWGGPLRLILNAENAEFTGYLVNDAAMATINYGFEILNGSEPGEPNWTAHQIGAEALIALGTQVADMPGWWIYDIVGGYPNDAVVPYSGQVIPNNSAAPLQLTNMSHVEQTSLAAAAMRDQLVLMRP